MSRYENSNLTNKTRRAFLRDCGLGLGTAALGSLLGEGGAVAEVGDITLPKAPHFPATAKRVIFLFMAGGPSHLDLFDHKPLLQKYSGQPMPPSIIGDQRFAFIQKDAAVLGSPYGYKRWGKSGAEFSEMLPHLGKVADDIALVKSMHTDQFNHGPGQILMNSGSPLPGRPCMGSWVVYGLGSETRDLPAFVVLNTAGGTSAGAANWSSGFLPSIYQGVNFRTKGRPILNVGNPSGIDAQAQRETIDLVSDLDSSALEATGDPEIETRIRNYEMAFRMQTSAPELMDLSHESPETLAMYGAKPGESGFANACILARRLAERGVRFINIYHEIWDHHSDIASGLKSACGQTDQASAALVMDLKQRGMLEDTLVVWGGEFGRTPMVESSATLGRANGRDHHPHAYTMWLAGGGIRPGTTYGETDDLGYHVVKDGVHIHDLQATILHTLGFDHTKLTYRFQGRDYRLTDVYGNVVKPLLV